MLFVHLLVATMTRTRNDDDVFARHPYVCRAITFAVVHQITILSAQKKEGLVSF